MDTSAPHSPQDQSGRTASLRAAILDLSRQGAAGGLSAWFDGQLTRQIEARLFLPEDRLESVRAAITRQLEDYRRQAGVETVVLGMSGGVDSALTAALFRQAGWHVVGHTLPIHQNPEETARGVEACAALGLEHVHIDLTAEYDAMVAALARTDPGLAEPDAVPARTRRGNLRARLRMMTLYDQAHRRGGIVASTDNFSELGAGFWTLHGDVGDLAPVQGLAKAWEIPWMARACGVPEATWRAKPTDGLGIGGGDEAQIGATYLEWDIMIFAVAQALADHPRAAAADLAAVLEMQDDPHARTILDTVLRRLKGTWHKRVNPIRFDHPDSGRFVLLDQIDERLFRPEVLLRQQTDLQFPVEVSTAATRLCQRLGRQKMRVVTAESCTGGMLAACLSGVKGSSENLEGAVVSYSPAMKIAALDVSARLIEERTVYDPEVAAQMARGALAQSPDADLALAITGVAGPGPDQGKPAGYVCIAAALRDRAPVAREFTFSGKPEEVLADTMAAALRMGLEVLDDRDGG